ALRHSTMWLLYKPSRRNSAPFSPSAAVSYSARISSLYLAVNVRRLALSGTSGSGRPVPAPSTRPGSSTPGARSNVLTLLVIREALHPRPRVTNCQGAGASGELDREGCRLLYVAERQLPREEPRRLDDERDDLRELRDDHVEALELQDPEHDRPSIVDDGSEPGGQVCALDVLALVEGDAFGVVPAAAPEHTGMRR